MRNSKLDQICAKRMKSKDFAQPQYNRLLSRNETFAFVILFLMAAICIGYLTITTYFA